MRVSIITFLLSASLAGSTSAQVAIHPTTIRPAAWERVAVRVVNQTDVSTVAVRLDVPEAFDILGVEPLINWSITLERATETTPQYIEWTGGDLGRWEFLEFSFFGRTGPDVREKQLIFPVTVTKSDGSLHEWNTRDGASAPPPVIQIVGTTEISSWGAFAIAAAAMGLSLLSIALAVSRKRST